jgi:signal transduction histidine kinase
VEVKVKDNGKGMPKEMIEKLIAGEKIGTTKNEGHGIGLQQIRGAIKSMNGKIEIKSLQDKGTEFVITFPVV